MASELIYTSARKGIRPGTSGFCTVAHTQGMSRIQVRLLESLSAYKNAVAGPAATAGLNPVAYSHTRLIWGAEGVSVLSRVAPCGKDHTHRDNKIAHHVVIPPDQRPVGGPAWLALQPGVFVEEWEGVPVVFPEERSLPDGDGPPAPAQAWARLTGDAGWAGVLAGSQLRDPERAVYVVCPPGAPVLPLFAEALALLPPAARWLVTFNTYFTQLPAGSSCHWRGCLPDLPQLRDPKAAANALVIDLCRLAGPPPEDEWVEAARGGPVPWLAPAPPAEPNQDVPFIVMPDRRRPALRMRPAVGGGPEDRKGSVAP